MDSEDHHLIETLKQEWMCPINKTPMSEPVVTSDGQSYEKDSIAFWLKNNIKSPATNLPLTNKTLIPNVSLKNLIQKIYAVLPIFLEKEESLRTEIDQLKEEIHFLRDELKHEKQKNDESIEKEEKEFKTRRIEKQRHEKKYEQINVIRDQKNRYQKQIQQLRSKQQQQGREILQLKDQLRSMTERFQKSSVLYKKYLDLFLRVEQNREQVFEKLECSFVANFTFIGHLLNSIEKAKRYQDEKQIARISQQTIAVEDYGEEIHPNMNLYNKGVIARLQDIIKDTVNDGEINPIQNEIKYREIHRFYMMRTARRTRLRRIPSQFVGDQDIYAGLTHGGHGGFLGLQQLRQLQQLQMQVQQGNAHPQQNQNVMIRERNQPEIQNNGENQENSEFYKQLLSIKWLMSKRPYREIPEFYDYQIREHHTRPSTYWYGIKLSVLESRIPFHEYFPHSWNHVRWLDLSSCNVDDEQWRKFIEKAHNFRHLMYLNVKRNKIENIKKADIKRFRSLVTFEILRNNLSSTSVTQIRQYITEHPNVKVEFNDPTVPNEGQLDWFEEEDD